MLRQAANEVSVTDFHRMGHELKEAKQHNAQLRVELEAAVDKLHVYRQSQAPGVPANQSGILGLAGEI